MTKVNPDRINSRICAIDFTCSYKILKMFSSVTENILYSSGIFVLLINFRKGYFLLSGPELSRLSENAAFRFSSFSQKK